MTTTTTTTAALPSIAQALSLLWISIRSANKDQTRESDAPFSAGGQYAGLTAHRVPPSSHIPYQTSSQ